MRNFSLRAKFVLTLAFLLELAPNLAHAQATGSISGTAKDESGAVLPGVTIEATNTGTNSVRTTITGPDGYYSIPLVQPGSYTVKATLSGFSVLSRTGVKVNVSETALVNFNLQVGGQTRERRCHRGGAPDRDRQRHPRHRHRRREDRRPALERTQLHPARHPDPRCGGSSRRPRRGRRRGDPGRLRKRDRRLQRQRSAQPVEQLPARRRDQQRHLQHRFRASPASRRHPGVQDPHPLLQRGIRPQLGFRRERGHQVGLQQVARCCLGVQSRRQVPGTQLLRARRPAQAEAEAEPVRRAPSAVRS